MQARRRSSSAQSSRTGSISRRDLPDDGPSPASRRKERYARAALGYSNAVNKTVGTVAAGGQVVGYAVGGVALGFPAGMVASIRDSARSTTKDIGKKPRRPLAERVFDRTAAISGAAVGGPILAGGLLASCAVGAVPAGYFGKKYLDKHDLGRQAWSYKPGDPTQVKPGQPCPTSEPRLPIVHSRVWRHPADD